MTAKLLHSAVGLVYNGYLDTVCLLAAEWVFHTVDGIVQTFCHDLLCRVLRQFQHEHARLGSYVPAVRRACVGVREKG